MLLFIRKLRQDRKGATVSWTFDAEGVRDRGEVGVPCQDIQPDSGMPGLITYGSGRTLEAAMSDNNL